MSSSKRLSQRPSVPRIIMSFNLMSWDVENDSEEGGFLLWLPNWYGQLNQYCCLVEMNTFSILGSDGRRMR